MTRICTGWNPDGYGLYAKKFADSFARFWPHDVELVSYVEVPSRLDAKLIERNMEPRARAMRKQPITRGELRPLWDCDGILKFIDENLDVPERNGRSPLPGWKPKDHERGYTFRWDCVKFCRQLFIPEHAAKDMNDGDVLAWFDADVITHTKIPDKFIEGLIGKADICYLGRVGKYHSEIGFWAVRLGPDTREFLHSLAEIYRTERVFKLRETHSAYVFDHCIKTFRSSHPDILIKNLTPTGRGHVWFQCALGDYTDHLKGDRRKEAGESTERRKQRKRDKE